MTYQETHPSALSRSNAPATLSASSELFTVRNFEISAVISGSTTPVTSFNSSYVINIYYTDKEKGGAIESKLRLYRWTGAGWQLESSFVTESMNTLQAYPTRAGVFAVMGETSRVYLPIVIR